MITITRTLISVPLVTSSNISTTDVLGWGLSAFSAGNLHFTSRVRSESVACKKPTGTSELDVVGEKDSWKDLQTGQQISHKSFWTEVQQGKRSNLEKIIKRV